MHTHLLHLVCNSMLVYPRTVATIEGHDDLLTDLLQVVNHTTVGKQLDDVRD